MGVVYERWSVGSRNPLLESKLQAELGIPAMVAGLLINRGITDASAADKFLNPRLEHFHRPELLPDYAPAVREIRAAQAKGDTIFVHGDYDADGVTSAAILVRFLRVMKCEVIPHVPHRVREGYGIHESVVAAAAAAGAKLFLTCDCGVAAHEQVKQANAAGMRVVVTDHHSVGADLPEAAAVINPHRSDSTYPFSELSGAGVAFKLCEGLARENGLKIEEFYRRYLDLAVLGTIADMMPLVDENRLIAHFGLQALKDTRKAGIQAIMKNARMNPVDGVTSRDVGWRIGPRLNAAGRIQDAALALRLLLSNDPAEAQPIADEIEAVNQERRDEQDRLAEEAIAAVIESGQADRNVIIIASENWHPGIIGIVAGKIAERFRRPTFVGAIDPVTGVVKASGRSIRGFDLASTIRENPELFIGGGGHAMAAGCSFDGAQIDELRLQLHAFAGAQIDPADFIPSADVDFEVLATEVSAETTESLSKMEPYGNGNRQPTFLVRGVELRQLMPMRDPKHAKLTIAAGNGSVGGILFGAADKLAALGAGKKLDLLFRPEFNIWQNRREFRWNVIDFQEAA